MQQVYIDQVSFPSFYNLNAKCKGHENKEGKKLRIHLTCHAPMRNQQVLLGFNRDPQKVQQYTCDSNENKMADA